MMLSYGVQHQLAKEQLPTSFYVDMDKWMNAYRKETKKAAKDGNLDSKIWGHDPSNSPLP